MRPKPECALCKAERYFELSVEATSPSKKRYYQRLNKIQLAKIERATTQKMLHPCDIPHRVVAASIRTQYRRSIRTEIATWAILVNTAHERFKDASTEYHKMILSGRASTSQLSKRKLDLRRLRDLIAQRERRLREAKRKLK